MSQGIGIPTIAAVCLMLIIMINSAHSKKFNRCELARILVKKVPRADVDKWLCIAENESTFNSAAINPTNSDGSKDFGIFQINNRYWCKSDNFPSSNGCRTPCSKFLDNDLNDDIACVLRILSQSKNSFNAWVAWTKKCAGRDLRYYWNGCGL